MASQANPFNPFVIRNLNRGLNFMAYITENKSSKIKQIQQTKVFRVNLGGKITLGGLSTSEVTGKQSNRKKVDIAQKIVLGLVLKTV